MAPLFDIFVVLLAGLDVGVGASNSASAAVSATWSSTATANASSEKRLIQLHGSPSNRASTNGVVDAGLDLEVLLDDADQLVALEHRVDLCRAYVCFNMY
jgi:hypothetical protein